MGTILLSSKNCELGNRLFGDSEEQIGKLCLDYVGMGLGLSDLFRSSSVPFFFPTGYYCVVVFVVFRQGLAFLKDLYPII